MGGMADILNSLLTCYDRPVLEQGVRSVAAPLRQTVKTSLTIGICAVAADVLSRFGAGDVEGRLAVLVVGGMIFCVGYGVTCRLTGGFPRLRAA